MQISPASLAALLMVLAAAFLIALTAIVVRPSPQATVTTTQAAHGPQPRAHGRAPSPARRTTRRGAGRRTARPAAPTPTPAPAPAPAPVLPPEADTPVREAAVTPPPQPPETVVEGYYRALDAGRFEAAWTVLTPAVQTAFGDFAHWRSGYASTLSSTPRAIEVTQEGAIATVAHELLAEDRTPCGPVRRTFAIRWKLAATEAGWRATSLTAVKRSGPEPAEACRGTSHTGGVEAAPRA